MIVMDVRLSEICKFQMGFTARKRPEPVETGGVPAIQLRDLRDGGERLGDAIGSYLLDNIDERYFAGPGDVLFRSRGEQNFAFALAGRLEAPAVALMPLYILRPDPDRLDGRYLQWFIRQRMAQRHFDLCAQGTKLRMIPKACLADLEIDLPPLKAQRAIGEVAALAERERELAERLAQLKFEKTGFALLAQARKTQPHGDGTGP